MRTRSLFAVVVLGLVGALGLTITPGGTGPPPLIQTAAADVTVGPGDLPDIDTAVVQTRTVLYADVERQIGEYLAWQHDQDVAAWIAAHQPPPAVSRQPAAANYDPGDGSIWDALAQCESGGNWAYDGPSGFDGGLQFLPSTWLAWGGGRYAPYAWGATREQQIEIAEGHAWSNWPACARKLGLL